MVEQKQVELLTHNVDGWNRWRQQQPEIRPDLRSVDLNHTNLRRANLSGADLSQANLSRADLSEALLSGSHLNFAVANFANFHRTNLSYADLSFSVLNHSNFTFANLSNSIFHEASLSHAVLYGANFSHASLARADLSHTYLGFANLSGANLSEVDLTKAHFLSTRFIKVDLSSVQGLDTARHRGPSIVDTSSVALPPDEEIRLHFLCGVGFTRTEIDSLPAPLLSRFIESDSLFISSARQDGAIASRLSADLREQDMPCWFTDHDPSPDQPIQGGVAEVIDLQGQLLLVLSKHSINSLWIEQEVDAVLHQEIERGKPVLFPVRLDSAILQSHAPWVTRLQHRHIADFTGWQDDKAYHQAFSTLLRHLMQNDKGDPYLNSHPH